MPKETQQALQWALQQTYQTFDGSSIIVTKDDSSQLVDKVRQYFNDNNITYTTFSYNDLIPYLK
jgi:hypothetical protein